jgi:hypothetical protein
MVKTRKNQKKQRGGFFGLFKQSVTQPSCVTEVSNYMTNDFNKVDVNISSLQDNISKIETCMVSKDIDNNDKSKLDNYSIQISTKLADKQAQYAEIANAEAAAARIKHKQLAWNKQEAKIREDLAKRKAQEAIQDNNVPSVPYIMSSAMLSKELKAQQRPKTTTYMGGNRKSKRKSRKSRKNIKKSKNNKR